VAQAIRPRGTEKMMLVIATQEAPVQIAGSTYQVIKLEGRDYYLKSPRPGSSLIEIWCRRPNNAPSDGATPTEALKSASRSLTFAERLKAGCANKEGRAPERFTFENNPSKSAQESAAMNAPSPTPRPAGARSFPGGTAPSILPDPVTPTGEFPDRY
jgi:hypothetical protein